MSPGASRPFTMDVGHSSAATGTGSRAARCASCICASARWVRGRQRIWRDGRIRRRLDGSRLVSARPARCVGAGISLQPAIPSERERDQHASSYCDAGDERLQQLHRESNCKREPIHVREKRKRSDRSGSRDIRECAARSKRDTSGDAGTVRKGTCGGDCAAGAYS